MSCSMTAALNDTRIECVSAEDSSTHCSTTSSRMLQQLDDNDVTEEVSQLPDTVVDNGLSSDILKHLTEKKQGEQEEALKHLNEELSDISSVCNDDVRTICLQLWTTLQDRNHRLETLKVSMEALQKNNTKACALWLQVEQEAKATKENVVKLKFKLRDCERRQTNQIGRILKKFCNQLVNIGLMPLHDVHRLIHAEAMRVNQSVLANRRSVAHLVLRLQEENLQKEAQLRLLWEEHLHSWRQSQTKLEVDKFSRLFSRNKEPHHQLTELTHLTQQRCDIISSISSLVPPKFSTALVSDWFNRLTVINQQIDLFHNEHLSLLHFECEQLWQDLQAEMELSKVELLHMKLTDEEVSDVVRSQLLPLIERRQSEDEERLAALNVRSDTDSQHACHLSSHVLAMMQGMGLLWETHCCQLKRREEELQIDVDKLKHSQHKASSIQEYEKRLEKHSKEIRQLSSSDAMRLALDKMAEFLKEFKHSHNKCVPGRWKLVDRFPSLLLNELQIYSSNIGSFFHLSDAYQPSSEDLEKFQLSISDRLDQESKELLTNPTDSSLDGSTGSESPTKDSQDWLLELCDISTEVTFTTSRGVVYSGPAFRSPVENLPEPHLSLFPEDLLTHTLDRFRLQTLENLEHHFMSILQSAVTTVTERREAVQSEEQLYLQKLDLQHIRSQVCQPRMDELKLHRRHVFRYRQRVANIQTSCKKELTHFQSSIDTKNQQFNSASSELEQETSMTNSIKCLEALSASLLDIIDQHITDTQDCYKSFKHSIGVKLGDERTEISKLLKSFRLFSDGGDCSPEDMKQLHMELEKEIHLLEDAEEDIYSELEAFMSDCTKEVKKVSAPLKKKFKCRESEVVFDEKIQKMMRSTNILITAEVGRSKQQQSEISRELEDLKKSIEDTQMSPAQTISLLPSLVSKLNTRCQYLDFDNNLPVAASDSQQPHKKPLRSLKNSARSEARNSTVQSPRKVTKSKHSKRAKSNTKIKASKKFHIFGSSPGSDSRSFSSILNTLLWRTNDMLLQNGENFYVGLRGRQSYLHQLPESADQWAESMQKNLLEYQEKGFQCENDSRAELVNQLSSLDELLQSLPSDLIGKHERQLEAELREAVGGVSQRLEEALTSSERMKAKVLHDLRPFMTSDELQSLNSVELRRQQQVEDDICRDHLELQECVGGRGEEFVTSLSSLMEQLLTHASQLTCDVTNVGSLQDAEDVAMEMKSVPQNGSSSVTTATTVSNSKLSLKAHEEKKAAVKRFQQLVHTELSLSERNKQRQLSQLQRWNEHWKQEIHTMSTKLCESS